MLNPLPIEFALCIGLDFSILIFFICLGLYRKSFAKMWDLGVYLWIAIPIINFLLIYSSIEGINGYTIAINVLQREFLNGSLIISIIICSLMYLPVILSKLKENFVKIMYIFWLEYLVLSIWSTVNIFPDDIWLQIPFASLLGLIFAIPFFYYTKKWNFLSIAWALVSITNIVWIHIFLNLDLQWQIPIDALIAGIYMLFFGFNFFVVKFHSRKIAVRESIPIKIRLTYILQF